VVEAELSQSSEGGAGRYRWCSDPARPQREKTKVLQFDDGLTAFIPILYGVFS
jgi:hypothetical protein